MTYGLQDRSRSMAASSASRWVATASSRAALEAFVASSAAFLANKARTKVATASNPVQAATAMDAQVAPLTAARSMPADFMRRQVPGCGPSSSQTWETRVSRLVVDEMVEGLIGRGEGRVGGEVAYPSLFDDVEGAANVGPGELRGHHARPSAGAAGATVRALFPPR